MQKAGYVVDKFGVRYPASLAEGIDFTRRGWPEFIRDVNGLSGPEPWGRWSDANLWPTVRFDLFTPLPQKFTLVLTVQPFGPNTDQELLIKIGTHVHRLRIPSGYSELRVPVSLADEQVYFIELTPPIPTSPQQLRISSDSRKLGIGFVELRIVQTED